MNKKFIFPILASLALLFASIAFFNLACSPWQRLTAMPTSRTEMASTTVNGEIYIIGGYRHPASLSIVEKYVPRTDGWYAMKDLPAALDHPTSVSLDNYIYVIGGLDKAETGIPSKEVFRYSVNDNKWDRVASLPNALGAVSAVAIGKTIHIFGGLNELGPTTAHYVYDIDSNEWTDELALPIPNDHMAIATDGVRVFLTGGREKFSDSVLSRLYIYNTKSKIWQEGPSLPTPRGDAQGAIVGKYFIVAGGENAEGKVFDVVEALDIELMQWKTFPHLRLGRHGQSAVSVDSSLYLIGGRDRNQHWGYTDLNEKLRM
jgi:N-acetylneuraminic acid mutarotase